jgi:hypothetical protein
MVTRRRLIATAAGLLGLLVFAVPAMAYEDEVGYDIDKRFNGEYSSGHMSHIAVGTVLGGSIWYLYPEDWNQSWRIPAAIGTALLVGTVVEVLDDPSDYKDVLEYVVPAAITVTILEVAF